MGKVQLPPLPCWLPPILNIKQKTCSHSCVCKCRKGGGGGRILEDENQVGNGVVSLLEARKKEDDKWASRDAGKQETKLAIKKAQTDVGAIKEGNHQCMDEALQV